MNKTLKLFLIFALSFSFQVQSYACWDDDNDDWYDWYDDDWCDDWLNNDFDDLDYDPIGWWYDPEDGSLTADEFECELPEFIYDGESDDSDDDDDDDDDIIDLDEDDDIESGSDGNNRGYFSWDYRFLPGDSGGNPEYDKELLKKQELVLTGKEMFTKMESDLRKGDFKTVKVSIVDGDSDDARKAQVLSTISNASLPMGAIDATVGAMQYFKYGTTIANNPFYAGIAKTFGVFGIPVAMGQTILICADKGSWGNMTLGEQLTIISGGLCAVGVCLDCAAVVFPPLAAVGTGCQIIGVGLGIASFFVSDVPVLIPLKNGKYLLMTPVYDIS
ncbi:MAG: hypothetical protein II900_08545 [Prevotella sp.]|nr:hypothetical protein [Prevotella sp.]